MSIVGSFRGPTIYVKSLPSRLHFIDSIGIFGIEKNVLSASFSCRPAYHRALRNDNQCVRRLSTLVASTSFLTFSGRQDISVMSKRKHGDESGGESDDEESSGE